MLKRAITVLLIILLVNPFPCITSYAKEESATELYKRDREAFYKKYMCLDEEAEEQGLYSDANNGAFTKRNKKNKNSKSQSTSNSSYSSEPKGWVYSVDELHVIGLPEDSRGYTAAGNYGTIPTE